MSLWPILLYKQEYAIPTCNISYRYNYIHTKTLLPSGVVKALKLYVENYVH